MILSIKYIYTYIEYKIFFSNKFTRVCRAINKTIQNFITKINFEHIMNNMNEISNLYFFP